MNDAAEFYFAQITDLHVGGQGFNPQEADCNLQWALEEIGGLRPRPALVLVTADLVCNGTADELRQYSVCMVRICPLLPRIKLGG